MHRAALLGSGQGVSEMDPRIAELLPVIHSFGLDLPTIPEVRKAFARAAAEVPLPDGVSFVHADLAGIDALLVRSDSAPPTRRILYFHGGGYVFGGIDAQKGMACRQALATGLEVVQPEYRLAPEHSCPAAVEDAVAAYKALLDLDRPIAAIAGDSAGGGLALLAAIAIRDAGLHPPPAIVLYSPWVDVGLTGARYKARFHDVVLPRSLLEMAQRAWLGRKAGDDPGASPLYAELADLPPTMIHVGGDELLLDDATRLAARLAEAGVEVSLTVRPGMIHVYPAYPDLAPEADDALAEVDAFLKRHG
jgi:acetyl esterase/lipase